MKYIYLSLLIISLIILIYLNNNKIETFMSETDTIPPTVVYVPQEVEFKTIPDSIPQSSKFPRLTKLLNEMIPIMKNLSTIIENHQKYLGNTMKTIENALFSNKIEEAKRYLPELTKIYNKYTTITKDLITYKEDIYNIIYSIAESVGDTIELVE